MRFHLGCHGDRRQVGGLGAEGLRNRRELARLWFLCSVVSLWVLTIKNIYTKEDLHSKEYYSVLKRNEI